MYYDSYDKEKMEELIEEVKTVKESIDKLNYQHNQVAHNWEYLEIEDFIAASEDESNQGYKIIDSSGTQIEQFNEFFPNIISVLNSYGNRGW